MRTSRASRVPSLRSMTARCPPPLGGANGQLRSPQPGSRRLPRTQRTRSCPPSTASQPTGSVPNGGSGAAVVRHEVTSCDRSGRLRPVREVMTAAKSGRRLSAPQSRRPPRRNHDDVAALASWMSSVMTCSAAPPPTPASQDRSTASAARRASEASPGVGHVEHCGSSAWRGAPALARTVGEGECEYAEDAEVITTGTNYQSGGPGCRARKTPVRVAG
jgi:hypothetical protein